MKYCRMDSSNLWGDTMKRMLTALTAGFATGGLLFLGSTASASVVDLFSVVPNVLNAGGSATLELQLTLSPDGSDYNAQFTGGSVTFNSGIGPSTTVSIS